MTNLTPASALDEWQTRVNATMQKRYGITLEDAGVPVEYLELTSAANHDPLEWVEWFADKNGLEEAQPTATNIQMHGENGAWVFDENTCHAGLVAHDQLDDASSDCF